MDDDRIELAVVGAGPCGLAILSRLSRDCTSTGTHELGPESAAARAKVREALAGASVKGKQGAAFRALEQVLALADAAVAEAAEAAA